MSVWIKTDRYELRLGEMQNELKSLGANSVDCIVTDPPYELNFMNKGWDNSGIAFQKSTWEQCIQVLKPGGYLLAFGGSRTFHRIACAIEDAGFEIRDTISWLYGSGFPKSMSIAKGIESKLINGSANKNDFKKLDGTKVESENWGWNKSSFDQGFRPKDYAADKHLRVDKVDYKTEEAKYWDGWGTALKPSWEPIIVARKPCEGSCIDNVLKYGVGGINIDECRVPFENTPNPATNPLYRLNNGYKTTAKSADSEASVVNFGTSKNEVSQLGRFPANTILTYDETDFDEVCGGFPDTKGGKRHNIAIRQSDKNSGYGFDLNTRNEFNDSGSASRYFYCAKASKKDRDEGLDTFEEKRKAGYGYDFGYMDAGEGMFKDRKTMKKNTHPTVKPTELMQYLIRLVAPKGATILDPFMGSGSTGKAAMIENRERERVIINSLV